MVSLAVRNLNAELGRFGLGLIAIGAAVAFVLAGSATVAAFQARSVAAQLSAPESATAVVRSAERLPGPAAQSVADAVGVTGSRVALLAADGQMLGSDGALVVADPRMVRVATGRTPVTAGEVLLDGTLASAAGARPGQTVDVAGPDGRPVRLEVVGIGGAGFGRDSVVAVTAEQAQALTSSAGWRHLLLFGDERANAAAAEDLAAALPDQQLSLEPLARAEPEGFSQLQVLLWALLGVVLTASAFVIANTFATVAAARQRETALIRLVGATRGQVRRAALLEAALVGVAGCAVGLAAGTALGWVVTGIIDVPRLPTASATGLAAAVGLGITGIAAWTPARAASRTAPVTALQESAVAPAEPPRTLRRGVAAGLGAATLLAMQVPLVGSVLGGTLGFLFLVAVGPWLVPRLATRLVRGTAPLRRLARANIVRTPQRSARTASALLLAVAMACTGAALTSALTSINVLESRANVDIVAPTITAEMVRAVTGVEGVDALSGRGTSTGRVGLARSADVDQVRSDVEALLPRWPGARLATADDLDLRNPLPRTLAAALGVMSGMALLIGLVGVVNTVLLGIGERRGELAMLRVLGMPGRDLRRLVTAEALGLTAIGLVMGLVLSAVTMYGLLGPATLILIPFISWWQVLAVPVITMAAALAAAWWPARRVARMDPAQAVAHL